MKRNSKNSKNKSTIPYPIVSPPIQLPLRSIDWDHFEAFCTDFVASILGNTRAHRYGGKGDDQKGIDIIADTSDGKHVSYQCRNYEKFGKTDFDLTVKDTEYEAHQYIILVAGRATPQARDACRQKKEWDIWDGDDISREIRRLPTEEQWRLVKIHFGNEWVEKFLGLPTFSPFLKSNDYFERLTDTKRLFHHSWQFIGRADQIQALDNFVASSQSIYILEGRGGIGKSKILKEFSENFQEKHSNYELRFIDTGCPLTPDNFRVLSTNQPYILVLDDAHQKEKDVSLLLDVVLRRNDIKIIFATRPQGKTFISSFLTKNRFGRSEISEAPKLGDLTIDQAVELAKQVLGEVPGFVIDTLARVAKDCPLILVIGGQLLAEKKLPLGLLERDDNFRAEVLDHFTEERMGKVSQDGDPHKAKNLLELISLIQPIYPDNPEFLGEMCHFTKINKQEILTILDRLKEVGLLLPRGYSLRIVPDVLGDHIASRACLTGGKANGFAELVFNHFQNMALEAILRNLGELDWRISQSSRKEAGLLDTIWEKIFADIETANNASRCALLKKLKDVAYYQPEKLLELINSIKDYPAITSEDPQYATIFAYDHSHVLAELPEILGRICYDLQYLPYCVDLIWEISRDDSRTTHQYPSHGIRILQELAQYDYYELTGKSIKVNKMMLDAVKRWIGDPHVYNYTHSPLDIVDKLLAKESRTEIFERDKLIIYPFSIHYENTETLREEALQIVVRCAYSPKLHVALRALKSLQEALAEPREQYGGTRVSDDEKEQWKPFQLAVLNEMEKIAQKQKHPLIQLEIRNALHPHIAYGKSQDIKEKAKPLFDALSQPFATRLLQALITPHDRDWFLEETYDYQKAMQLSLSFRQSVVDEFVKQYPDPHVGFVELNVLLEEIERCHSMVVPIVKTKLAHPQIKCACLLGQGSGFLLDSEYYTQIESFSRGELYR